MPELESAALRALAESPELEAALLELKAASNRCYKANAVLAATMDEIECSLEKGDQ